MPVTLLFVNVAARPRPGCAPPGGRTSGRREIAALVVHLSASHSRQLPAPRQWASLHIFAADHCSSLLILSAGAARAGTAGSRRPAIIGSPGPGHGGGAAARRA